MKIAIPSILLACMLSSFFYLYANENSNGIVRIAQNPEAVLHFIQPRLPDTPFILECGAYDGNDTTLIAKLWPQGRIYAFEPIPELYAQICKKTKNFPNVKTFQAALGDVTRMRQMYLSYWENGSNGALGASSSLLPPKKHLEFAPEVSFKNSIEVVCMTLDDWALLEEIDHIDFLWLDMQGMELNLLKNSEIAETVKVIYLEVEFIEAYEGQYLYPAIKAWMVEHGFVLIATDFDESLALLGDRAVTPKSGLPWFGNAIFEKR